ncbi:AbgT family transporter [Aminobacterium mobile]|jgi:aminobenzoyl-glutamate transport protein|uniref:AbgT family transporter n=1 Tax=Aminobacterium mobile TaxID=81467 RepID=UPI0004640601|nr:AbgT family transporter [Aminobacterium mobile]
MVENKKKSSASGPGLFQRFIKGIEIIGNKLPHPFWLFVILSLIVIILSFLLSKAGVSVTYMAAGKGGEAAKETTVAVTNLISYKALRPFFANFVKTYVGFAPLGLIMTMMLGIGLIEQTGLISALMRKTIMGAPSFLVTAVLAFVGINANLASDAGIIFTPAIGAAVFKALGRNPWVGIVTGYAAASGGFTANLFIAGTDALLAGITESVTKGMNIPGPTHPLINWYFLIGATFIVTFVTTFVTERFTVKILGDTHGHEDESELLKHAVTPEENRGLRYALIAAIICIGLLLYLTVPQGSFFRADDGTIVPKSPLLSGVVAIIFFLFFFVGIAYGYGSGSIKEASDIPKLMQKGLQGSLSFLVVALPASLFINLFNTSNMATILSVRGAEWLEAMNLGGIPLLVMYILLCTFLNLFIMSGSAKWLILAPIFVPMFSMVGFSPALTQLAYRIGDSSSNIITPLSYYLPVVIGLMEQYKPEGHTEPVGMGTVISLAMPYTIAYLIFFTLQLIVWYMFNIPIGPGASLFL